jgi:hypothetical protein
MRPTVNHHISVVDKLQRILRTHPFMFSVEIRDQLGSRPSARSLYPER